MWIIAGYITELAPAPRSECRKPLPSRVRPSPRRDGAGTMAGTDR
jgi:hypothetical protein